MSRFRLEVLRRARAAAVLYAYRLVASFVVAYPAARAFGVFGAAPFADGDLVLFEPGGVRLLEALRFGAKTIATSVQSAGLALFVLSFVGLLPLAAALTSLTRPGASVGRCFELAVPRVPGFALLSGAAWLARAVYAAVAAAVLSFATTLTSGIVDERAADIVVVAVGLLLALGLMAMDVFHDLARAAVARFDDSPGEGAKAALQTAAAVPGRVFRSAAGPAAAAVALVATGAALTSLADVGRAGGGRVAAVFAVHQLVVLGVAFARAHWLASALELVAEVRLSATAGASSSDGGLLVDLDVSAGRPVPGEVEAHNPAP